MKILNLFLKVFNRKIVKVEIIDEMNLNHTAYALMKTNHIKNIKGG